MADPDPLMQLDTLFVMDDRRRFVSTREPQPASGPAFFFVRGASTCAWAVGAGVPEPAVVQLQRLAEDELPSTAWEQPLRHAQRYAELVGTETESGPAFGFPDRLGGADDTATVDDERELGRHFSGWIAGEIAAGRAPVLAVRHDGHAVSVCFCARRSAAAAEAGIETAPAFRGRGYAPRAAAAWSARVRSDGLTPIYSTDWRNGPSLAVARQLRLVPFAADFAWAAR